MMTVVIGGASSGKSMYAEKLLCRLSETMPRIYLATMRPYGKEAVVRIAKHRKQRETYGFFTMECPVHLESVSLPAKGAVLLEDMGNLCANELYDSEGSGTIDSISCGVRLLQKICPALVIVSNEVGSGGTNYEGDTLRYLLAMGRLNQALVASADTVCEVVCGIPQYYKGEEPC